MKLLFYFILMVLFTFKIVAQNPCPLYQKYIDKGDSILKANKNIDFEAVINAYSAAMLHCPDNGEKAREKILAVFRRIEQLKKDAEMAEIKAKIAEAQAKKDREKTNRTLIAATESENKANAEATKNKNIIDKLYFYADSFALATQKDYLDKIQYGFINKEGKIRINFNYSAAQPFDEVTGLAVVKKKVNEKDELFLLNTAKNEYRMEYTPSTDTTVIALDLRDTKINTLPAGIWQMEQLQILLLNANSLDSLPSNIGQLNNLTELDLRNNQLKKLPHSFLQLSSLQTLYLQSNDSLDWQQICGVLALLPQTVHFSIDKHKAQADRLWVYFSEEQILDVLRYAEPVQLNNFTNLYLRGKELKALPTEIGKLSQLKQLYLMSNELIILPTEIGKLSQLTYLELSCNELSNLPPEIGELENLQILDLGYSCTTDIIKGNQLSSLPTEIAKLKQLRILNLQGNNALDWQQVVTILDKFLQQVLFTLNYEPTAKEGGLWVQIDDEQVLKVLEKAKATQISEIMGLEHLNLYSNMFKLRQNALTRLPSEIRELKKLKSLSLGGNDSLDWKQVCEVLAKMSPKVQFTTNEQENQEGVLWVYIDDKQVCKVLEKAKPTQLDELKNLQSLDLGLNLNDYVIRQSYSKLPSEIIFLKKIKELYLIGNDSLDWQQVCGVLAQHPQQIKFTIDKQTPQTNTLWVYIETKQVLELLRYAQPNQLDELKNLTTLDLSWNKLESLPAQIEKLTSLTTLYLRGNQLKELPAQIGKLKNLAKLDLRDNFISEVVQEEIKQILPNCEIQFSKIEEIAYHKPVESAAESKNFAFAQQIYEGIKDKEELPNTNYGSLSWWFVFAHCFEGAIWAGERYVAGGEKEIGALSNLAMGYLYNGDNEKAKAIYAQYKNEKDSKEKTGKKIFLEDLRAVADAKVPAKNPADVEKMIRFLEE